jgi:serine/threonine-protein kinase
VVDSRVGTTFGKYSITRLLGKGGMGEVYEAYDTDKGRTVALKILATEFSKDAAFRTRFRRESQAAAILREPHVIPIHDWGEIDGSLYIDMRLVQGQTLLDLIEQGPLEPSHAVSIIGQVGAALDSAHAEGLIHRDVKPQNILVTPADFAYLVDFGIAEATGESRLTTAGSQIGTLNYMAPERFRGPASTPAVDVYSLTCVLYESLTGEIPFTRDSLENLVAAHIASPPPRPSEVNRRLPVAIDDVVARGMAKDPDDRYGSAGAVGRAALRALQIPGAGASAAPSGPTPTAGAYGVTVTRQSGDTLTEPTVALGDSGGRRRGRVLPIVLAVATVLILGGIGVVIGLLIHSDRI